MIEGVIKIQESKKKVLFGVIYYGDKKEQPVPTHLLLSKELDNKKCLFRILKPGILKKNNQKWYLVELDMVKVLTVVDRHKGENIDGKTYEKTIYFAGNQKGEIEKISIKASTGGIDESINRKTEEGTGKCQAKLSFPIIFPGIFHILELTNISYQIIIILWLSKKKRRKSRPRSREVCTMNW